MINHTQKCMDLIFILIPSTYFPMIDICFKAHFTGFISSNPHNNSVVVVLLPALQKCYYFGIEK
jgi:hypothetical protein